jgi:acyl-CoA thioesterase-1
MRKWPLIRIGLSLAAFAVVGLYDSDDAEAQAKKKQNLAFAPVVDVPGLPRVLLLGDSISIGYTLDVQAMLKGKANVHRPAANCQTTKVGLQQLDAWLGAGKWDVIHFNFGLHDLKFIGPDGVALADPTLPTSKHQITLEQYEKNLDEIVSRLKKTGAKLIWCSTTPVPPGSDGRRVEDAPKYNEAALRVMKKHNVAVDDLYTFALGQLKEIQRPANVHFTDEGSKVLAGQVVKSIETALSQK